MRYFGWMLLLVLFAACSENGAQQTLVADNAALSTQISDIRSTATFQRDVLQITLEYIELGMTEVVRQNNNIGATLQATGVSADSIAQVQPGTAIAPATTPVPQNTPGGPAVTPEIVSTPLDTTAIVPTPTAGEPMLFNLVMAEGVGDNDCALAAVTSFVSSVEKIYVVATANNIVPGTILGAQWFHEGALLVSQDFSPQSPVNQNCIWFYVDQTDFPFAPGNYTVQLTINSNPAGQPVAFAVTG